MILYVLLVLCVFILVYTASMESKNTVAIRDVYKDLEFHKGLLNDSHRVDTYRTALTQNPSLMKDATVLDVGCGTGILSALAVEGGASKVVGVDMVSVPKCEGVDDVQFVTGKPIQKSKLPIKKYDVIVSEFMGCALYEENITDMFLYARDKYLKPGGALLPDRGSIYVCGFKSETNGYDGCKTLEYVDPQHIVTDDYVIHTVDFTTVELKDTFEISSDIRFDSDEIIDGLVVWFDAEFTSRFCKEHPCVLNTKRPTSWFHTVLRFTKPRKASEVREIHFARQEVIHYTFWVDGEKFTERGWNIDWYEETKKLKN
jgi:SAM-dependent methyltransferase